ncbi:hypothetical protein GCM10010421_61310 [Streptomyces glaucus]|uniref:Uncharacterized protein n=1 Tax=Streptomyces glaucus TaxID=284029 RepID=A0ABP5XQE5_9ACTN
MVGAEDGSAPARPRLRAGKQDGNIRLRHFRIEVAHFLRRGVGREGEEVRPCRSARRLPDKDGAARRGGPADRPPQRSKAVPECSGTAFDRPATSRDDRI